MSTNSYDEPVNNEGASGTASGSARPQPSDQIKYEPPCLIPAGNLCDLLGKSGANPDYRNRIPHATRP